ncbi:hypothetical protein K439DRAFT_685111 [Ramaria rubella]|nr:hypothetical protein K439DRAFT_685111 [Ramaria rubella]
MERPGVAVPRARAGFFGSAWHASIGFQLSSFSFSAITHSSPAPSQSVCSRTSVHLFTPSPSLNVHCNHSPSLTHPAPQISPATTPLRKIQRLGVPPAKHEEQVVSIVWLD